jgi:hypothetical protein
MKAYRAHNGTLRPGESVPPSAAFFDAMSEEKRAVESLLEAVRPQNLPKRENAIFLFEDEAQGRKWTSRTQRNMYLVELERDCILLRADWCWLPIIMGGLKTKDSQVFVYANNYWAGKATERPVWELLLSTATIAEEVNIPQQERTRLRCEALGQAEPS